MLDNISILITGNPYSSSGFSEIGKVGTGLVPIDPQWPMNASGDRVMTIAEKDNAAIYCLMFHSTLISADNGSRTGVLNFQLKIPFGYAIMDAQGDKVSPFKFMLELFKAYESSHLTKYPGVAGWNFSGDGKMTPEEFERFTAPYSLTEHRLPSRHLKGTGEVVLVLKQEEIEAITLDYAYPELTVYAKLILCQQGITNPIELSKLVIPRKPIYEIFVNGVKQDCLIRKGDEPFTITVMPDVSYKLPKSLKVDCEKAIAEGLVDFINERIDYTLKFEDKVKEHRVKVKLTGCEGNPELYRKLLKEILDGIDLQGSIGFYASGETNLNSSTRIFTMTGKSTEMNFKMVYKKLPQNVSCENQNVKYDGEEELVFKYKKLVPIIIPSNNDSETVQLGIFVQAEDEDVFNKLKGKAFDLELSGWGNKPSLIYKNVTCGNPVEISFGKNKATCYTQNVEVVTSYLKNARVEVFCEEEHFKLNVNEKGIMLDKKKGIYYVIIEALRVGSFTVWKPKLTKWLVMTIVFALGWWIGENYQPFHRGNPEDSSKYTVVIDSIELSNKEVVTFPYENYDSSQNEDITESEVVDAETGTPDMLTQQAKCYLNLINTTHLSFEKVREIQNWINNNSANSRSISQYDRLNSIILQYGKAMDYIKKIDSGSWDEAFPKTLNQFINGLPHDRDYKHLRVKMQKLNNGNMDSDVQVGTNLILFKQEHPNGVSSFSEL